MFSVSDLHLDHVSTSLFFEHADQSPLKKGEFARVTTFHASLGSSAGHSFMNSTLPLSLCLLSGLSQACRHSPVRGIKANKGIYAARCGDLDVVELLLEKGANVNAETPGRWTALTSSAWNGSSDMVELLQGRAAAKTLMCAACLGDLKLLQQLSKEEADVNLKTPGDERTPLMGAARRGYLDVMKALIALGANVNAKAAGHTALTVAAEKGNAEVVRLLLDKGADVTARANGRTALEITRTKGRKNIEEILRAHSAKD